MCLVALFFQVFDDAPVIVGANREELYARGGEPPRLLDGALRAVGGVDPTAGGTWLGVNERGLLIAVTNRPKSSLPVQPRSRGLLARELLGCGTANEAADHAARELESGGYAGCNVLCVDRADAVVIHATHRFERRRQEPGLHLLTANDLNDPADTRQEFARTWLSEHWPNRSEACVAALQALCGLTGDAPMCLRREEGGTVSSAVIALREPLARGTYLHAQGPPDCTPYADYGSLLRTMSVPENAGG